MRVVKIRILMWVCGVTRLNTTRNRCKIASLRIPDKNIIQNTWIWFGRYIERRNNYETIRRYVE